jgi:serine/threonine protein kinase
MERAPVEVQTPQSHGKYHPIAELGQGGTANVYLAVARGPSDFNKLVVLKVLRSELADESEFRQMFMSEARLSARLNHPNVVQTNEIFQVTGRPIIVMEYLEGQPLSRIIARSKDPQHGARELPLAMHLRILIDVLNGLHYSHELTDYDGTPLCVVHRDMTPQNVFVSYDGRVCVLDFGIAKLTGGTQDTQTGVGVVKGKLRYMPAEQLLATNIDRRADIFAVGVMLWEALTGDKMWRGLSDGAIINHVINGRITPPRELKPDLPEELERICMKALAFDREDRYASAAELEADLERFLGSDVPSNRTIGKLVNELFSDDRAQLRSLIERQLGSLGSHTPNLAALNELHLPPASSLARGASGSFPQEPTGATSPDAHVPSRGRTFAVVTTLVLFGALTLWFRFSRQPEAAPETPETPVAASPASEPASTQGTAVGAHAEPEKTAPSEISLRVSVLPATAQLYIDERPLPSNPYLAKLPRGDERHTIRAEAPGHVAVTRVVTYGEDANVELTLEPLKPTSRRPRVAKPSEPESAEPRGPNPCEVPYYMDEKGIRRIKRECL